MRGPSLVAASGGHSSSRCGGPLTIAASLVAEHRLQTRRLSNCGSRAQLLRGMWDPPRAGPEPVSPAVAGRLSTTAPPGKPSAVFFKEAVTWLLKGWDGKLSKLKMLFLHLIWNYCKFGHPLRFLRGKGTCYLIWIKSGR